jgi:hypothetical protein
MAVDDIENVLRERNLEDPPGRGQPQCSHQTLTGHVVSRVP